MSRCACEKCKYMEKYRKLGNKRYEFFCVHPDHESILKYYREKQISAMPGFLGFAKEGFPKKQTPPWCPMEATK